MDPSIEEKRRRVRELLGGGTRPAPGEVRDTDSHTLPTYGDFLTSDAAEPEEMARFHAWVESARAEGEYAFERPYSGAPRTEVELRTEAGHLRRCINLSSYNYLGYGQHPEVIAAAKDALDRYGLGAASSPVASGTLDLHHALETELVDFLGVPGRAASLFTSGYGVNTGTISAFLKPGHHAVLDQNAHASIVEGAHLAGAQVHHFTHNDPGDLRRVLDTVPRGVRTLVCVEGVYSADGDFAPLADFVEVVRRARAHLLVDEAHSVLVGGPSGRGVAEAAGVLDEVDLYVLTFSKAFGAVGGAVIARPEVVQYINWFARCRMFSCALDPATTAGALRALQLARSSDGAERRQRLLQRAAELRRLLLGRVDIGPSESWIIPVMYGSERRTLPLASWLHDAGVDGSVMQFPAVPRNESRIRLFVTSEHTPEQLRSAADILAQAAERFGFLLPGAAAEGP